MGYPRECVFHPLPCPVHAELGGRRCQVQDRCGRRKRVFLEEDQAHQLEIQSLERAEGPGRILIHFLLQKQIVSIRGNVLCRRK
jgi:hypothetical protein